MAHKTETTQVRQLLTWNGDGETQFLHVPKHEGAVPSSCRRRYVPVAPWKCTARRSTRSWPCNERFGGSAHTTGDCFFISALGGLKRECSRRRSLDEIRIEVTPLGSFANSCFLDLLVVRAEVRAEKRPIDRCTPSEAGWKGIERG